MCNKPIRIRNNSKYIPDNYGHQLYIWVNCGHCKECISAKQNEWNLRTFYEMLYQTKLGNWMYFDTLTYSNKHLPRITNFIETTNNWACFNPAHIREFYERLRGWYGDKSFRYFIVSEYGTLRNRPHYHILLFVDKSITDKIKFSKDVAKAWQYGRTDGQPYKSRKYVLEHNCIDNVNYNTMRYMAKYVTKSQHFMDIINKRWNSIENYLKKHDKNKYNDLEIDRIKQNYYRNTNPFHRQSQHYGEAAMILCNWDEIWENGRLYYKDDTLKIMQYIQLPMYFKRKLTQQQIKYNGKRIWINTQQGIQWKKHQEEKILDKITERYQNLNKQQGDKYTNEIITELAKYTLFQRGRIKGINDYKPHMKDAIMYNYNTKRDRKYLGKTGYSKNYIGNDTTGYITTDIDLTEELPIQYNKQFEDIINDLQIDKDTKSLVLLKEHLREIKKEFFK